MDGGSYFFGTSGWSYKHWVGVFYPPELKPREHLGHYFRHFDTVEINSSFYHLPLAKTFENWRDQSPPGFTFAVKGSRYITHVKKLLDPAGPVERFWERAQNLGQKLGPMLWQLPPNLKPDLDRLEKFLQVLPVGPRHTIEFRNPAWFEPAVFELLRRHGVALCLFDLAGLQPPLELTADFIYFRFHGERHRYGGDYREATLSGWADRFRGLAAEGRDVYCYFNNDLGGFAIRNALRMRELLGLAARAA